MQQLLLARGPGRRAFNVLCIGAHCDDIDIGCGGALLSLLARRRDLSITWVTFSGTPVRQRELRASAGRFLRGARRAAVVTHGFRDSFFPSQAGGIKEEFERLKQLPRPDVIFTHQRDDLHQDHRVIAELTWNTFRDDLILEYEIPKYEGGLSTPSVYIGLSRAEVERKIRILVDCYKSQRSKAWFSAETLRGLMRIRGIESGSTGGWAEGFHGRKLLIF
jgi:LmbE family N-acetylglucosaminyl deacetylase